MSAPLDRWEGEPVGSWREAWGVPSVEAWARMGSTNDRALELSAGGAEAFTVVLAGEQTSGRGRRGASWHSAPGSGLWMSVVLPSGEPFPWLPLLVGLAVAEAIEAASGLKGVGIKWPNDLILQARKVGGILCESSGRAVVAGVGINLREPPGGFPGALSGTATALDVWVDKSLSAGHLAGLVVGGIEAEFRAGAASLTKDTLARLQARDALAGRAVETEERGPGTARGFGPDGALILERPDGSRVSVTSGSVRAV